MKTENEIRLENAIAEREWCLLLSAHNTKRADALRAEITRLSELVELEKKI